MSGPAAGGRPLNAAQLGVWYAQRLAPASQVFNMGGYVDLFGPVAPGLLAATLAEVVAEDETTRLRFTEVDGVPCQYLAPREEYAVEVVDLRAEPDPVESALGRIREDMSRVPDLEHGPLFHHELFQVGPEHIIWYNRAHHLIQDGYSGLLLRRRAGEIYARLAAGADGQDPGTSFDSFWRVLDEQEAYEGSSAQRRDRAYWGRLMADAECPPGPGAAEGASYRIAREVSYVDRDTFERLREFSERAGVSWQQALIGAAVLHRHRWTDESDVLLSLPVTGRLGTVGRWAPGMTANVLPLRCRATGDETCEELVARVATQALRAQWHQRYDAAALLRDLGWPADGRRQFGPVINVLAGDDGADFAGMASVAHLLSTGGTAEDLAITVTRGPDEGLRVDFTVDAAYERVVDLAAQRRTFHRVIDAMTARPGVLVREVELLDAAERELVLRTWNDTSVEIPERSLGDLFE
ncbi:condensation domain-containing protein, partial [Streptomyces sp. NPDC051569]|uniref:condensation domain-containing protein n=1 Tax=Streptomyces sp. NPDC051569 TaxID=3365661 RepID=UPI00379AF2DB